MTELAIPCETFVRLVHVATRPGEGVKDQEWRHSMRFEIHNGTLVALTTCGNLIAIEKLADIPDAAEFVTGITVASDFVEFVSRGVVNDDVLLITVAPGWTVARLASGPMYPNNADWPHTDWPAWRDLLPADQPKKAMGVMAFQGEHIARMAKSAPSGTFTCPRYVDPAHPVVVRDTRDPNWVGIFKVNKPGGEFSHEPATIPDWVR